MHRRLFVIGVAAFAGIAGTASGQTIQRRASLVGGGNPDHGRCTVQVVVDGAAEVEIRGDSALLRNLNGQAPQWRRFECTSIMPPNAPNFRFVGIDGRGSQELVRGPQGNGPAVIRIQDPEGGADGYTFELSWGGGFAPPPPPRIEERHRWTTDEAVKGCQAAVTQQAMDRFHSSNIAFRRTAIDDAPGRQDWVTGFLDIRRGYDRDESYRFSCSVNFDTGQVRSAQIDPLDRDRDMRGPGPDPRAAAAKAAIDSCQRAVDDRVRNDGYQHIDFLTIRVDDRPGRSDWVMGTVRADVRFRSDSFDFACNVNLQDGAVRNVTVHRH
jgi:hypothetical protein